MSRRFKPRKPPALPFADADAAIDLLEQHVIDRTVDSPFTAEQVVRTFLPDEIVDKLQAAFPYTRDQDRTSFHRIGATLPVVFPAVDTILVFKMKSPELHMLVPAEGLVRYDERRGEQLMITLRHVYDYHLQFEKVRKVVRWLNKYATIGAARHYCPWMTSLLPADHDFQSAGPIYREPTMSMLGVVGAMRESGAIMAGALLCGEYSGPVRSLLGVHFAGKRDEEDYNSNVFGLL